MNGKMCFQMLYDANLAAILFCILTKNKIQTQNLNMNAKHNIKHAKNCCDILKTS